MKSYINKFLMGAALVCTMGLGSCINDLDQLPKNPTSIDPGKFQENPKEYIGGVMGKCYSGIAVSGQSGAGGDADISGLDGGTSCWSRAIYMLNEFTTDECKWIWPDAGIVDLVTSTWSDQNANIFGTYSRLYTHIAICNEFMRLINNAGEYGISFPEQASGNQVSRAEVNQLLLEARALRDLSYFYVIDLFGNAALCWDDQEPGSNPVPTTRTELYNKVVADLENILAPESGWKDSGIYGRIGRDAVEALLVKFYLNAEVFSGKAEWQKCWDMAQTIIKRHQGSGFQNSGLAEDYLALFCGNNDIFGPGGSLKSQYENLWTIPYSYQLTESYGGSFFLMAAAYTDSAVATPGWYGMNAQWTCMHTTRQFAETFNFSAPKQFVDKNGNVTEYIGTNDDRCYLWLDASQGFSMDNTDFSTFKDGYVPIKFTNVECDATTGLLPRWNDPETGLPRVGVHDLNNSDNYGIDAGYTFPNTDLPLIRLAEIYLSAAEAHLRGGVGNATDALQYVNYVRERAKVQRFTVAQFTLPNILEERGRELYWENCRRTDLIRFGKFTNGYNWNWKNGAAYGTDIASHMTLFPIPSQVRSAYAAGTYPQNPGY
ncbi:MAG: RagB/SusD family nutrient uptake outer membrane protein [Bacteroidales bacterium]|nr:RagB/SusD family nutrient uptake outer membrane protein [Bacteroidales bacterium]